MKLTAHIWQIIEDDFFDMCRILKSASPDWDERVLRSAFAENYFHWGIFLDDKLVGFAIVRLIGQDWELLQFVIDKTHQSMGLGKRLLQFLIAQSRKDQIQKILLEVRASNLIAIGLYQSFGFYQVGIRKKYYEGVEDAVLMDLVLYTPCSYK